MNLCRVSLCSLGCLRQAGCRSTGGKAGTECMELTLHGLLHDRMPHCMSSAMNSSRPLPKRRYQERCMSSRFADLPIFSNYLRKSTSAVPSLGPVNIDRSCAQVVLAIMPWLLGYKCVLTVCGERDSVCGGHAFLARLASFGSLIPGRAQSHLRPTNLAEVANESVEASPEVRTTHCHDE